MIISMGFVQHFIDNITNNLTLTYEFIRLNLPGSLPDLTTLNTLISNSNLKISEGEFRFDQLQNHFDSLNVQYAFYSEDTNGVVKKIKYDFRTNTFTGFPTPLDRGIPIKEYYQTDSFNTLNLWFNSIDKIHNCFQIL